MKIILMNNMMRMMTTMAVKIDNEEILIMLVKHWFNLLGNLQVI